MAVTTRGALAGIMLVLLVAGVLSNHFGRKETGIWLTTMAFAVGTLWSGIGVYWTQNNTGLVSTDSYIALTALTMTATVFYGYKAMNGIGLTERL